VIGSLLMARLADRLRAGQWIVISFMGMGIAGILYSAATSVPLAIFYVMLSGFLNAPSAIARRLIIQRNTQREVRGRVFSAFFVSRDVVLLLGMAAAGLADIYNVRALVFVSSLLLVGAGIMALVMPGLGQPAAEWRRTITLLRGAKIAPRLGAGRAATLEDMDLLAAHMPALAKMSYKEKEDLAAHTLVADAPTGTPILLRGEISDSAYFILQGQAVAGREEKGAYRTLETLNSGDFFGEIAALTGVPRTADVIVSEPTTLLQVPAPTLRSMMSDPQLNHIFLSKMTERMVRMDMVDMPRYVGLDQTTLRQLRTAEPEPVA
jgi:CRP-like cAMP-binding protein